VRTTETIWIPTLAASQPVSNAAVEQVNTMDWYAVRHIVLAWVYQT